MEDHRGRDHMVVGFTTTSVIIAYHHESCEFEPRSWRGVLYKTLRDKVCQWLRQVGGFLGIPRCPPPIKLTDTI